MSKNYYKFIFPICVLIILGFVFFVIFPLNKTDKTTTRNKISTLIVPHDDFAKNLKDEAYQKVSKEINPSTIIIVSTNHFNSGTQNILSTNKTWNTNIGKIAPNNNIIHELENSNLLATQDSPFEREHGIYNQLESVKKYFNDSKIIPIIIKNGTSLDKIQKLDTEMYRLCNNCLLIASIDFSHYQLGSLAEIHDVLSLRSLYQQSEEIALRTESDSPETLALAILWSKNNDTNAFELYKSTNSSQINDTPDTESTSYILGWYNEGQTKLANEMTFMFAGDAMFGRGVYYKFPKLYKAFENLGDRFFLGTDISMLNLEGPISNQEFRPDTSPDNLIFKFPPQTISALKWLHINAVGIANNHTLNQGTIGLENTIEILNKNNISSIGNPGCYNDISLKTFESGRKNISVIAVNASSCNLNIDDIIHNQKNLSNYVIIFVHWGNEYEKTHSKGQEQLAHLWISHGADLIIGTHPHIIQDAEIYEGKPIFYSIGNFIFDQTFSPTTQTGLVIAGIVSDNNITIVPIPISLKSMQPEVIRGQNKFDIINTVRRQMGLNMSKSDYGYDKIEIGI